MRPPYGKEDYRLHQASGAGRQGQPVAPDRSCAGSARRQHHGILQGVNASTGDQEVGTPLPTVITVYADRSFSFETKTPPATFLIKKAAGLKSGSKEPGKTVAGKIKRSQLSEIATAKMKDLNANDIDAATRIIEGSARAMGLEVVEG